jgi:hypothetical protein
MTQIALFSENDRKSPRICECCGAKIVEYRHSFNQSLASSLYKLYSQQGAANISKIGLTAIQWTNFQKLKYWGLVQKAEREDHTNIGGVWKVTQAGLDFVERGTGIQKQVWSYRGKMVRYEGDTIFFMDLHDDYIRKRPDYVADSKPHQGGYEANA